MSRLLQFFAYFTLIYHKLLLFTVKDSKMIPFTNKIHKIVNYNLFFGSFENYVFVFVYPQAPVAQKNADELDFRHSQGEGVEFF